MLNFKRNKFKYLLIVSIITSLIFAIVYMFFGGEAEAAWFNNNWYYRKAIETTNSGSAQADFQIKVFSNFDMSADVTNGKVQADFDDLRFTDNRGKILPYWIEDSTSNSLNDEVRIYNYVLTEEQIKMDYNQGSTVRFGP